jgi:D-alanyl-D-alanine carboxypeptidase/D-alanyl-D-alanine-endopeptidase (penicillin-binding protein 4)
MENAKMIPLKIEALILAATLFSSQAVASAAEPASGNHATLKRTLTALAGKSPGNSRAGISVIDVTTGEEIYSKNPDNKFNPASNAKIITAACALKILGPDFEFVTSLHGRVDGAVVRGPVYLKGHADPTLSTEDLWIMARALTAAGVRRVEGGVVVDDTYFDEENLPFAFEQQPNEDAGFRAPVGAVSLNHNVLQITISPGRQAMSPARVFLEPSGYAVLTNDSVTVSEGSHNPKISSTTYENRTKIRVWGNVPVGSRPATYTRRIDNPSLLSGHGLKSVLEASGITVGGGVQVGPMPSGVPMLAEHLSQPLSVILYEAGKHSNNFVTETVLKTLGAEAAAGKGPGTWNGAIGAAKELLTAWGLDPKTYVYRNGSGLFDANRFSPRHFTKVLRAAYIDGRVRPEFLSQLAVGGVDGTLRSRYKDEKIKSLVRAKTGTLADVSTLSGYVFDASGQRPVAFSILVNDAPGYVSASRAYQEKIVTAIAKHLNP